MKILVTIAAAIMLAAAPFASANAASVSKNEISKILSEQGYAVRDFDTNMVSVVVSNYIILVGVAGADGDISYIAVPGISGDDVSYQVLNKFNNDVKFGRAFIDSDGDVRIQMDRNASGGVTAENIESDFDVFLLLINAFLSHLESQAIA